MNLEHGRFGRLVRVITETRRELTGFYAPADVSESTTLVYIHGLSGSADTSFVFDLLSLEKVAMLNVLLTNNSGRANITITRQGETLTYARTGSAFERFEECVSDIKAWVDLCWNLSKGPVVLMGHSLGASKAVHYLAGSHDERIGGLVLASPADVTGGFTERVGAQRFQKYLEIAKKLVAEGQADQLMPNDCVIGLLGHRLSAATYINRFDGKGAADAFNFFGRKADRPFQDLEQIQVPILVLYAQTGELVADANPENAVQLLKEHAVKAPSIQGFTVSGDHWYTGHEAEAMGKVLDWVEQTINR